MTWTVEEMINWLNSNQIPPTAYVKMMVAKEGDGWDAVSPSFGYMPDGFAGETEEGDIDRPVFLIALPAQQQKNDLD